MSQKSYFLHFRPKRVPLAALRFTYTWGLGGTTAVLILLSMISGVMLKFFYIPTPDQAYASVLALDRTAPLGRFMRNLHYFSANLLIVTAFLHLLRVFFTGAYQQERKINWVIGLFLMGLVVAANFTGYLLPWDQLSYWAVTVSASALTYFPVLGGRLREMIIGGQELGAVSLTNFFTLHTAVIPAALLLLPAYHFWRIRRAGGLAAGRSNQAEAGGAGPQVEAIPHLIVREMAMAAAALALVMVLASLWDAPLGAEANPGLSPNPTKAPWYMAGLQEMLLNFHPLAAVAVIPLSLAVVLTALPFLPHTIESPGVWFGSARGRKTAAASGLLGFVLTPALIIGQPLGPMVLTWLSPLCGLGAAALIYLVLKYRFKADTQAVVQGFFTFLLVVFLLLTVTGIWFRGPSMALVWPWG